MRCAAIMPQWDIILDHLGVLSSLLDIPLLVSSPHTMELCHRLYPQINAVFVPEEKLTVAFLADHYDMLFVSYRTWAGEMLPQFETLSKKKMRIVFCPHGDSDKGHSFTHHPPQDIALVYGDHMLDLLKQNGGYNAIQQIVRTGNYRLPFFLENAPFYANAVEALFGNKLDPANKTIFYAPTWEDQENPSSFYLHCKSLIESLPDSFNLLIKLHPFLFENSPGFTTHIVEKYKDNPSVLFVEEFPPIYPLIARSDLYLGDFSSIGYDFLAFDKPLYFMPIDQTRYLDRCGMRLPKENWFEMIAETFEENQTALSGPRKEAYAYAFGMNKSCKEIAEQICRELGIRKNKILPQRQCTTEAPHGAKERK